MCLGALEEYILIYIFTLLLDQVAVCELLAECSDIRLRAYCLVLNNRVWVQGLYPTEATR